MELPPGLNPKAIAQRVAEFRAKRAKGEPCFSLEEEIQATKSAGLGDTMAKITSKMGIKPCPSCKKRQQWANRIFPYGGQ
jgi:hypothetical protein